MPLEALLCPAVPRLDEVARLQGRVLLGRFRLEERLGFGGMGSIWRAQHLVLNAPIAVKLLSRDALANDSSAARFLREAQAAAALRSPHVVQIIDYGIDEETPFIAMELLEGETLAQRLKRVERLNPATAVRFLTHVGRAVTKAHEAGIVHRDLKPANVFIVYNEGDEIAKVLDFGVAKVNPGQLSGEDAAETRTGSVLGTPYYMSPEQAQGNKQVDFRSDLWAMGVIAFECITGKRPFYSDALGDLVLQICVRDIPIPSEVAPVPPGFDAWFAKATARIPDERFQSAKELMEALRDALGAEAREVLTSYTELVVSVSDGQPSERFAATPQAPRATLESGYIALATDATAPTLAAPPGILPSSPGAATLGTSAPQRALQSALETPISWRRPRRKLLGVVAGLALVGGALAAVFWLEPWWLAQGRTDADATRPRASGSAQGADAAPRHAASSLPLAKPSAAPNSSVGKASASAAAKPSAAASALPPRAKPNKDDPQLDAGTPAASASVTVDAGWVKPAWARPDEPPPRKDDLDIEPTPPPANSAE